MTKYYRMPELGEFEATADHMSVAGYYGMGELTDTSTAERTQSSKMLAEEKPGRARLLRKVLDCKAPPAEAEPKKSGSLQ